MCSYDFVVCIPPIGQVNYPYISVPLLKAAVESEGFSVLVSDSNIDFLNYLITCHSEISGIKEANRLNTEYLNHDVLRMDNLFTDSWVNTYSKASRVFGFSLASASALQWALKASDRVKMKNKDALIVFGGPFCDIWTSKYILSNNDFVNIIVIGEGEDTLIELLKRYYKTGPDTAEKVPGTVARINNKIVINEPRPSIQDLDNRPFPDYSALPLESYLDFRTGIRILPILGSRSCVSSCSFCSEKTRWHSYRTRSPENIVAEIRYQYSKNNVSFFRFNDSVLNSNTDRLEKMCDLIIDSNLNINWVGNVRIHKDMSPPILNKMYKAGCRILWYGIESASPRMLKIMRKAIDVSVIPNILKATKDAGIMVLTFWISNFPQENPLDTQHTIEFFRKYGHYIDFAHFSEYHLHKDSHMFHNPGRYGIRLKEVDIFGNPIWEYREENFHNAEILKEISGMYIQQPKLPWNFVGAI